MIRELKPFLPGRNKPFAPEHIEMYLNVDLVLSQEIGFIDQHIHINKHKLINLSKSDHM